MNTYELVYLILPNLKNEEVEGLTSEISAFLQKEGGLVIKAENPAPKTLGYQIKEQEAALQVGIEFSSMPEKIKVIEDKIRKDPRIIRYMLIAKKASGKGQTMKTKRRIRKEKTTTTNGEEKKSSFVLPLDKTPESKTKKKVELKDIEEKLEEILKE